MERMRKHINEVTITFAIIFIILSFLYITQGHKVLWADGYYYYVYLRSAIIDFDIDFKNEYEMVPDPFYAVRLARGEKDSYVNTFPIGAAILWSPFFLLAHSLALILSKLGYNINPNGFSPLYIKMTLYGTTLYGFLSLILVYKLCSRFFSRRVSLAATIATSFGSFILWYIAYDPSMPHAIAGFAVSLFIYYWLKTNNNRSLKEWIVLGAIAGLMMLVRSQEGLFMIVVAIELSVSLYESIKSRNWLRLRRSLFFGLIFILTVIIVFSPQLFSWKYMFGGFFSTPQGRGFLKWGRPLMGNVLFSTRSGLFVWSPILYLSTIGLLLLYKKNRLFFLSLLVAFILQLYLNSIVKDWWAGTSFGARRFGDCLPIFGLGLAGLLEWFYSFLEIHLNYKLILKLITLLLILVFIVINIGFIGGYRIGIVSPDACFQVDSALVSMVRVGLPKIYHITGNPFSFPANWLFSLKYKVSPADYDILVGQYFIFGPSNYGSVLDFGKKEHDKFLVEGFSPPQTQEDRITLVWSNEERSRALVPLNNYGKDYLFTFRVAPFLYPNSPPQTLKITLNRRFLAELKLSPDWNEYKVRAPKGRIKYDINELIFEYGYAISPRELGIGNSKHKIGVAFDYLRFELLDPEERGE